MHHPDYNKPEKSVATSLTTKVAALLVPALIAAGF